MTLLERYHEVLAQIARAAESGGRDAAAIELIAVSKKFPATAVAELAEQGQQSFGENRLSELIEKQAVVERQGLTWHLIGQLQTNKVKMLPTGVLVHSLDRISLAQKLEQHFSAIGGSIEACIQVNCSGEAQKSGVALIDFDSLVECLVGCPAIKIVGLMTMAEDTIEEKKIRHAFSTLRLLSEKLSAQQIFTSYRNMLSMGMSGDFAAAIAEGATHVRIGSAIFAERA